VSARSDGRWWWIALFLGLLIIAASFFLDAAVDAWVVEHQTRGLRKFMQSVSFWGDWFSHAIIGVAGAAVAYALGRRDWLRIFLAMILACALAGAAVRVIKITAGRSRPSVTTNVGWKGPTLSSKYHAFPSGHTASSVAFFVVPYFARRRMALLLLPIPALIGIARILVEAHHLSDVVVGALLGVLCAYVTRRFMTVKYRDPA
jgi:undecaprenyl-diphosphatase